jgi:site-specific DNA-methyltransferase (adenine-specific)
LEKIELLKGDCLELMKSIGNKSIDAIICDLPYGTTACKWDSVIPFEPLWAQYKRIIKDNGVIVLFGQEPFSSLLRMSNIKEYKYDWIWDKVKPGTFATAKYQPLRQHELISVFYKNFGAYIPQMTLRDKPKKSKRYGNSDSASLKYNDGLNRTYTQLYPKTILKFSNANQKGKVHPTQKPVALMEYLVKTYTNQGDIVLDNCMGSGTTGVACKNLGRNFIGIEQDSNYYNIAFERIWKK